MLILLITVFRGYILVSDLSDNPDVSSTANTDRLTSSQQQLAYPAMMGDMVPLPGQTASSIETLLRNIQGLLKVAADNARHQERQISLEKGNLFVFILVFKVLI